jgi:hypothetical protein
MKNNYSQYVLHLNEGGEGTALPLSLEGYPTKDSEGNPIHYRKVLVAPFGDWVNRGTGKPLTITPKRADEWIKNVAALSAAGLKPFITPTHCFDEFGNFVDPDARDILGYVERMERDDKGLYSILALYGDESLKVAAKNSRSIGVGKRDVRDDKGNVYNGETLHHLALCPNPSLLNLGGTQQIAASGDTPSPGVPVFVLSDAASTSAPSRKGFKMKPENAQQVRAKLGFGADVPDDQLDDKAAEKALALSASVITLTADLNTIKTERDAAKAEVTAKSEQVLALSGDQKDPDDFSVRLITKAFKTERDQVIAAGVISPAGMDELDKMFYANGKPTRVALSLSAGSTEPMYSRLLEILKKFPGIRTDNGIARDATKAEPNSYLRLSGDGGQEESEAKMIERTRKEADEYRKQQLAARGISA